MAQSPVPYSKQIVQFLARPLASFSTALNAVKSSLAAPSTFVQVGARSLHAADTASPAAAPTSPAPSGTTKPPLSQHSPRPYCDGNSTGILMTQADFFPKATDMTMTSKDDFTFAQYEFFVESRIKWLASPTEDLLHAAVGLIGEVVELIESTDRENFDEELGDCCFYLQHAWLAFEKSNLMFKLIRQVPAAEARLRLDALLHHSADFLNLMKKAWVYGKGLDSLNIGQVLFSIESVLNDICDAGGDKIAVLHKNYCKLLARYPNGYSDAAAQARADKVGEKVNG